MLAFDLLRCRVCGDRFQGHLEPDARPICPGCLESDTRELCAMCGQAFDVDDLVTIYAEPVVDDATGAQGGDEWIEVCRCCASRRDGGIPCGRCEGCKPPPATFDAAELAAVVPF